MIEKSDLGILRRMSDLLPKSEKLLLNTIAVCASSGKPLKAKDIALQVAARLGIELSTRPQRSSRDRRTDLEYKLAWVRTSCAQRGFLKRSKEGWTITDDGKIFLNQNLNKC